MAKVEASVVSGTLFPTPAGGRVLIKSLRKALQSDPDLRKRFKTNPRRVLGDRGFARELQNELLTELGKQTQAVEGSCACTGCCATSSLCCSTM